VGFTLRENLIRYKFYIRMREWRDLASAAGGLVTEFKPEAERFVESLIDRSPYTMESYRLQLRRLQRLVNHAPLECVTVTELVEGLRKYRETHSLGSMISMVAALKGFLRFVGRDHDVAKVPKFSRRRWLPPEPPSPEQLDLVLERATLREAALILMFYSTGARPGEVFGDRKLARPPVHAQDVDWDNGKVRVVGKGGYPDYLVFWLRRDQTLAILCEFAGSNPARPLFPFGYGLGKKLVRDAGRRIGVRLCFSLLRHACATSLLKQGVDSAYVNRQLRHVRFDTTRRYLDLTKHDLIARAKEREWR